MNRPTRALVLLDDRVDRAVVETLVTSDARLDVRDFVDLDSYESSRDGSVDVVLVACKEFTPRVGDYVSAMTRKYPGRPLLLLCGGGSNGYVADAIAAGAEDIIALPTDVDVDIAREMADDVVFAVQKAAARRRGAPTSAASSRGKLICVLGLKGGSGKTLVASNLAVALADTGASVAIIDLDVQFGDIGLALMMSPERTLYDLVRSGGSLDAGKLADFLTPHSSGVRTLLAPARPDQAAVVTASFLKDVYPLLCEMFDYVIVDTPPSFTPEVIGAIDASSEVCLVAMLDSLSLKNTKLGLETLERMDYQGRIRLVLNRADSNVGISSTDVTAIMGRTPEVLIPSDRAITRAVNQGEPIVTMHRGSEAARAFQALAKLYVAENAGEMRGAPVGKKRRARAPGTEARSARLLRRSR